MRTRVKPLVPALVVMLLTAAFLAGCIEADDVEPSSTDATESSEPAPEIVEKLFATRFEGTVTGFSHLGDFLVDSSVHEFEVPGRVTKASVKLEWSNPLADIDLRVMTPDGQEHAAGDGSFDTGSSVTLAIEGDVPAGKWAASAVPTDAVEEDYVLTIEATYLALAALPSTEDAATTETPRSGSSSGETRVDEGKVRVERDGNQYVAKRTITYASDAAGIASMDAEVATVNGGIDAEGVAGSSDAVLVATLYARGSTEDEARQNLADIYVEYDYTVTGDAAVLSARARLKDDPAGNRPWNDRGVSFAASWPDQISYDATVSSTNGGIDARGLHGSSMRATTTNGGIRLSGLHVETVHATTTNGGILLDAVEARSVEARTTNGGIKGDVVAEDLTIETTNAGVILEAAARASGTWAVTSTNGGLKLTVPEDADRGYDLKARTGRFQDVSVDMSDVETVDEDKGYQHVRTNGYESRGIQTGVSLTTTNGNIQVEGS